VRSFDTSYTAQKPLLLFLSMQSRFLKPRLSDICTLCLALSGAFILEIAPNQARSKHSVKLKEDSASLADIVSYIIQGYFLNIRDCGACKALYCSAKAPLMHRSRSCSLLFTRPGSLIPLAYTQRGSWWHASSRWPLFSNFNNVDDPLLAVPALYVNET